MCSINNILWSFARLQVMGSPEVPGLPLWFPLSPSYWRGSEQNSHHTTPSIELPAESPSTAAGGLGSGAGPPPAISDHAVSTRGLTKVYRSGGGARVALDAVDLDLRAGRVTAVLGHNGAGKGAGCRVKGDFSGHDLCSHRGMPGSQRRAQCERQ